MAQAPHQRQQQPQLGVSGLSVCAVASSSMRRVQEKDHFANLAVDAVLRLKGSQNLESIHIIKKPGGTLRVGFMQNSLNQLTAVPSAIMRTFEFVMCFTFIHVGCIADGQPCE